MASRPMVESFPTGGGEVDMGQDTDEFVLYDLRVEVIAGKGKMLWSEPGLGRCTMIYADGTLIVFSERGLLYLRGKGRLACFSLAAP